MRIGLKIGSAVLADGNGKIYRNVIDSMSEQIAFLKKEHEVVLVSSGAIAADPNRKRHDCVRAAVGQPRLLHLYEQSFKKWNIECAQLVYTDFDLSPPYNEHTKLILESILAEPGLVPIINANDPVDGSEVRALKECADNDVLFKKVCLLLGVDMAIIGFTESGLYNKRGGVIPVASNKKREELLELAQGGSDQGHGQCGMRTKVGSLLDLAQAGIYSALVCAHERDFLLRSVQKEKDFGTVFVE